RPTALPPLPPFPTRRSSDLLAQVDGGNGGAPLTARAEPERLLTVPEVAQRLQVKRTFVYDHRKALGGVALSRRALRFPEAAVSRDRKSTRLNSSHVSISYAV